VARSASRALHHAGIHREPATVVSRAKAQVYGVS
jgi:hypothetical protein